LLANKIRDKVQMTSAGHCIHVKHSAFDIS
jgi:hypothetical protein